jgi:hypothetical protein
MDTTDLYDGSWERWTVSDTANRQVLQSLHAVRSLQQLFPSLMAWWGVAGSIPDGVIWIFRWHYGPGVDSTSNRNDYQVYFLGVKAAGA